MSCCVVWCVWTHCASFTEESCHIHTSVVPRLNPSTRAVSAQVKSWRILFLQIKQPKYMVGIKYTILIIFKFMWERETLGSTDLIEFDWTLVLCLHVVIVFLLFFFFTLLIHRTIVTSMANCCSYRWIYSCITWRVCTWCHSNATEARCVSRNLFWHRLPRASHERILILSSFVIL